MNDKTQVIFALFVSFLVFALLILCGLYLFNLEKKSLNNCELGFNVIGFEIDGKKQVVLDECKEILKSKTVSIFDYEIEIHYKELPFYTKSFRCFLKEHENIDIDCFET